MVSFAYRMAAGIPGHPNRVVAAVIEPQIITPAGTTGAPTAYGVPVVIDAAAGNVGNVRTMVAADTVSPYGLLVRPFPTGGAPANSPLGTGGTPPASGACDVMVRGYMSVLLAGTTAATKGGPVYVWTAASNTSGAHVQGGFEAASSAGNVVLVANSYFTGPADANGITEIAFQM